MRAVLQPSAPEDLCYALASAKSAGSTIELFGGNSKRLMAGPVAEADVRLSTCAMRRVLQYEPRDLTISVESGLPFAELNALLARNNQMIPLEGPYAEEATVGGMIAANISGERRRLYGTARDLVIGMKFATLEGKLVQSGGMVVKNVAGLDMGKLMVGSFGTLAAIASINFKLTPRPALARTMLFTFDDMQSALQARDAVIRGLLSPVAVDLINPLLSAQIGMKSYSLALSFAGNQAVIERCLREASAFGPVRTLSVEEEQRFWNSLHSVTPRFLEKFRDIAAVVRISATLAECGDALESIEGPGHLHATSGIVRGWFTRQENAARCIAEATKRGWKTVIEFSSDSLKRNMPVWPEPGADFAIMKEIKKMFDPGNLLNRGRLYGQL